MSSGPGESVSSRPRRNFTRVEYDKMIDAGVLGEDEHVELIGGAIVEMSPEGSVHAGTIDLCAEVLRAAFGRAFTVRVQHPFVIDPDAEPDPDLVVVAGGPRAHLGSHPRSAELVVEVADSSLAFDRREKAPLYSRARIPEYWIVNLVDRVLEVRREPTPGGYARVEALRVGDTLAPVGAPGAVVEVAALMP